MTLLPTPHKLPIPWNIKISLGCISKKPVIREGKIVKVRDTPLCYHDLYHLEVANLDRIQIGKHQVSGINGINSSVLHESPIIEEYDGVFDEVRVAFHEFITKISFYNTVKAIFWISWLIFQGINPAVVIWRHYLSLKLHSSSIPDTIDYYYQQKKEE